MKKNKQPYYVLNYYHIWGFDVIAPMIEYCNDYDKLFGGDYESR